MPCIRIHPIGSAFQLSLVQLPLPPYSAGFMPNYAPGVAAAATTTSLLPVRICIIQGAAELARAGLSKSSLGGGGATPVVDPVLACGNIGEEMPECA